MTHTITAPELTGIWSGDPVHSELGFKVRHMGVGRAGGTLTLTESTLNFGTNGIEDGSVTATADASSVDTNNDQRNEHVRSADFLDAAEHPTIDFQSTSVRDFNGTEFELDGELTIRGITKPVTFTAELLGAVVDAYGNDRVAFAATGSINRKDFDVNFSAVFGVSNAVVSDKVEISIEAQFVRSVE